MRAVVRCAFLFTVLLRACNGERYHKYDFSEDEMDEMFGVRDENDVPDYTVTKVNGLDDFDSGLKSRQQLSFDAYGQDYDLDVEPDDDVIPSTIEYVNKRARIYKKTLGSQRKDSYSRGHVGNDKRSMVSLHHSDRGIAGSIQMDEKIYKLIPLPTRFKDEKVDHVVYPLNRKDDHIVEVLNEYNNRPIEKRVSRETKYPTKTIEILLAGDFKFVEYHGKEFAPKYLTMIANIMADIYGGISMEYPITIALIRTVLFEEDVFHATSMTDLLSKFASWAVENNAPNDADPNHFDAALLITKAGACADGCKQIGFGYPGMCGKKAEGVVRDDGIVATGIAASHELGHVLMQGHDGSSENAKCKDGVNVMASGSREGGRTSFEFSPCVSSDLKKRLLSKESSCFDDAPTRMLNDPSWDLYGLTYGRDQQCEWMFGKGYLGCTLSVCKLNGELRCDKTYCNTAGQMGARLKSIPLLHGTPCGPRKWCIYGQCISNGTKTPVPVDGHWTTWSAYGPCSRTCTMGVQSKYRECVGTKNGGKYCKGAKPLEKQRGFEKPCQVMGKSCATRTNDIYTDQDKQCFAKTGSKKIYCQRCVDGNKNPCALVCGSATSGTMYGNVAEGTVCKTQGIPAGICVTGKCKRIYCDGSFDSALEMDRCFKCGGDGTTCKEVRGKKLTFPSGSSLAVTIPAGAWRVDVQKIKKDRLFVGFTLGSSSSWAAPTPQVNSQTVKSQGVTYPIKRWGYSPATGQYFQLKVDQVIKEDMHVKVLNYYGGGAGLTWSYLVDGTSSIPEYRWYTGEWTVCSKLCGSGLKTRELNCRRSDDQSYINPSNCRNLKKPTASEVCSVVNCPGRWVVSEWGTCTKECAVGTHTRTIDCYMIDRTGKNVKISDNKCDPYMKPDEDTTEKCNMQACPPKWFIMSDFGTCSQTCGAGGVSSRQVICKRVNEAGQTILVPDLECEGYHPAGKPVAEKKCNEDVECAMWVAKKTKCSKTCGTGVQEVTVTCQEYPSHRTLPSEQCKQSDRPTVGSTLPCNEGPCLGYKWVTKESVCSKSCGTGIIRVSTTCQNVISQTVVDDGKCDWNNKPFGQKKCDLGACVKVYEWKTRMSTCSKECGRGFMTTIPYCVRVSDGGEVVSISCDNNDKPTIETKSCNLKACDKFEWKVKPGKCLPCEHDGPHKGSSTEEINCYEATSLSIADDKNCHRESPVARKTPCQCPGHFVWKSHESKCSVSCGKGWKSIKYGCVDAEHPHHPADSSKCKDLKKPDASKVTPCEDQVCPVYEYKFNYGACNTHCGKGYKIEYLQCVNRAYSPSRVVEGKNCKDIAAPVKTQTCSKMVGEKVEKCKPAFPNGNFYQLGCFNDQFGARGLSTFIKSLRSKITWTDGTNLPSIIQMCYKLAQNKGMTYFAIQYWGECWGGGEDTSKTYNVHGPATDCKYGVGNVLTNMVYHIGSPVVPSPTKPLLIMGCYTYDTGAKLDAKHAWDATKHADQVSVCATQWNSQEFGSLLGVDSTGKCLTKSDVTNIVSTNQLVNPCDAVPGELIKRYFIYKMMD